MGFRKGAYAKIWGVEPVNEFSTKLRLSTSKKNKTTGEYEQDFSGFVSCMGESAAKRAAQLSEGDRIKIVECEVTTTYNKEKKVTYTNFKIYDFEVSEESAGKSNDSSVDENSEAEDSHLPF